mgnify:CR=1 FL=1
MLKKRILSIVLALTMLMVPGAYAAQPAKDDMHGVWVASVHNIDFPSEQGMTADQLKAGKIDAIVITVGTPSPVVTELAGECGIRLLNVDGTAAQRLLSSYNAYREVTIPAGTYPGQDADVQTVGVKAVLLASDSLPAKQVQQLTELLFSSREALEEQLGLALDPETDAVEGVGIPFHAGAAAWYKQAGITVD